MQTTASFRYRLILLSAFIDTDLASFMDFRPLRYFVVLVETLHLGRAAERLHITQLPLSRQIAALDNTLSVRLFARHSRSVALTPAGSDFMVVAFVF